MTILFDVRMYRPSAKRLLHTSDPRGAYVATVYAVPGALADQPDDVAVRAALPHQLRKAFDRSGSWWRDVNNSERPRSRTLYSVRGSTLGTLYATRRETK